MDVVSPGSNIARQLLDLCACVPYPWGKVTCRHYIITTLRFSSIVSRLKIYHHCLCYMFNHVDTSWPFGVLEYQQVNRVQYFECFCPRLLALSISFSTDFTIHKLSSPLYTSQVYFFKHGLKSFFL